MAEPVKEESDGDALAPSNMAGEFESLVYVNNTKCRVPGGEVVPGERFNAGILSDAGKPVWERTVEVFAPSNLAGGYEFFVNAGINAGINNVYKVRVPDGGVGAGQRFDAVIQSENTAVGTHNVPFGRWRDGLCDCCAVGVFHPVCCLTYWCYPCALGQVLHRMKLNACANPTADGRYPAISAFKIFFALVVAVYSIEFIVSAGSYSAMYQSLQNPNTGQYPTKASGGDSSRGLPGGLFKFAMRLFCCVITMRLRTYIRERYNIPGSCCEDCCCSLWCLKCTICQLARHTADFKTHLAGACTDNGLFHRGAPEVV
jgi:Cys-rich protein (TIGR01571 family)